MDTKPFNIQAPESVAKEYGGNKQQIAQAAQMGLIDPTTAVLAGMFIDRMRTAQVQEQQPPQTVAQDVMAPQPPMQPPMQPGMEQGMDQGMGMPQEMAQGAPQGLPSLPIDPRMFNEQSYAGGGIVAFQAGGRTPVSRTGLSPEDLETNRLREQIRRRYALTASPLGVFTPVGATEMRTFHEKRRGLQDLLKALPNLNKEQLQQLDISLQEMDQRPSPQAAEQMAQQDIGFGPGRFAPVYGPQDVAGAADVQIPGLDMGAAQQQPPAADPLAPQGINFADIIRDSGRMARDIMPSTESPVLDIPTAGTQVDELLKQSGFDQELFAKQKQQIQQEKESLATDRKEAINMRIIEAGLGIMAGESPNAFVNIGKGATPAVQGLAKDIKEIKTAERAYSKAQMDLDSKMNDFAMGKAGMTQKVIDQSQARADRERDRLAALQGDFAKTMLSGQIQKEIAKATYASRMTDFDKKWAIYKEAAEKRGETPSPEGFVKMWGRSDAGTELQQLNLAKGIIEGNIPIEQLQATRSSLFGGQAPSRFQEGQKSQDTSGRSIVFRNGQWVYE